jgi:hypothetical protein
VSLSISFVVLLQTAAISSLGRAETGGCMWVWDSDMEGRIRGEMGEVGTTVPLYPLTRITEHPRSLPD